VWIDATPSKQRDPAGISGEVAWIEAAQRALGW
jgi:hypothetical protein